MHGDEIFIVPTTVVDSTAIHDVTLMFGTLRVHMFEHPELLSWEACLFWQGYRVPALPKEDRDVDRSLTIGCMYRGHGI